MMTKDFKDLLRLLNANRATYLIIGGHAYGVYAEPRTTKDLDLFIKSDPENAKAVYRALAQFGAPITGITEADFTDGSTLQIGMPPNRIDILQRIDGVAFDEAWAHRIEGVFDEAITASVISREDLIRNKLAAGRDQDLLDVKVLRAAERAIQKPRP
jgi:hypothetical protein